MSTCAWAPRHGLSLKYHLSLEDISHSLTKNGDQWIPSFQWKIQIGKTRSRKPPGSSRFFSGIFCIMVKKCRSMSSSVEDGLPTSRPCGLPQEAILPDPIPVRGMYPCLMKAVHMPLPHAGVGERTTHQVSLSPSSHWDLYKLNSFETPSPLLNLLQFARWFTNYWWRGDAGQTNTCNE